MAALFPARETSEQLPNEGRNQTDLTGFYLFKDRKNRAVKGSSSHKMSG
jgi:hypothetical protein